MIFSRHSIPVWMLVALVLPVSGCAITRKSASYDSESRMPFLGMEFAPRKKTAAPETQRIRRDGSIQLEPEPAKLVVNGSLKEAPWWPKKKVKELPKSIPLPRTDLGDSGIPPVKNRSPEDSLAATIEF